MWTAATSGLRFGELTGLSRRHVDLSAPSLRVERALADIKESIRELRYYRRTAFVAPPGPPSAELAAVTKELGPA